MPQFDPTKPYDLPPLPPPSDLETRGILKLCIAARAALAELKQAGEIIPNQAVLINTLPLLEAQASSAIENIVTTSDRLFRHVGRPDDISVDSATKEALRYGSALTAGFRSLKIHPLNSRTATDVCSAIKGVEMEVRRVPGTALLNDRTGAIVYTPPAGQSGLLDLLSNWETFIHNDEDGLDPTVKLAVMHYQFEAIHPFTDGNGRTGRILNLLYLIEKGVLEIPVMYLSRYVLANRTEYYRLLQNVTEAGDWTSWIEFIVRGVRETALWTTAKIKAIRRQMDVAIDHIRVENAGIYSRELVDIIFSKPYVRIGDLVEAGLSQRQTASLHLRQLAASGVLREVRAGREKLFVHPAFVSLLTTDINEPVPYSRG